MVERPVPGVLADDEREAVEVAFGVDSDQVIRDHLISHALAAISIVGTDDVLFFGGTALSRTHLTDLRACPRTSTSSRSETGPRSPTRSRKHSPASCAAPSAPRRSRHR